MYKKFSTFIDFILSLIANIGSYCAVLYVAAEIKSIYLQDNAYRIFLSALVDFIELLVLMGIGDMCKADYRRFSFVSNEKLNELLSVGISVAAAIMAFGLAIVMGKAWIK